MSDEDYELGKKAGRKGPYDRPEGVDKDDYDSGFNETKHLYDPNKKYVDALMAVPPTQQVDYKAAYEAMYGMYEKMSAANLEKFQKYWPESMAQGMAAGQQFDVAGRAQADEMNKWLFEMAKGGNVFMREEAAKSNLWMMEQVRDVNVFNAEQFYGAMDKAMPGLRDTAASYKATIDQMLTGELPEAVRSEITQATAERGLSQGVYGPAYGAAGVRDLGLNRLQYLQSAQGQVSNLVNMAGAMMAPVAQPNIYQNVMMTPTPYTPSPANIAGIQGNYLSAIMGQTMMQPQAGVQAGMQAGGLQAQINMANTNLQYSKAMSMMQYGTEQQKMQMQQSMFEQQMGAQREQRWWDLGGSLLGMAGQAGMIGAMGGFSGAGAMGGI